MAKYVYPPKLLIDSPNNGSPKIAYAQANRMRMMRIHAGGSFWGDNPRHRLGWIAGEINCRILICKREIYFIGELLTEAKGIVGHGNFQKWVEDNCEFSYQTANNFMNVYAACLGNPHIVDTMRHSVLYRIAAPGFPADLREHIFAEGSFTLEMLTAPKLKELLKRYRAGELSHEDEGIRRYFNYTRRYIAVADARDRIALCLRDLQRHRQNIATVGGNLPDYCERGCQDPGAAEQIRKALDIIRRAEDELMQVWEYIDEWAPEEPDYTAPAAAEDAPAAEAAG